MHLLLFDVDATLVMTGGAGVRAMSQAFEDLFGVANGFDGIPMAGRTDPAIFADALRRIGRGLDEDVLERFRERYCERLVGQIERPAAGKTVMPGVSRLLQTLASRADVFLALLTGNFAQGARIKLEHFGLWRFFRCGAFGDDDAHRPALVPIARARAAANGAGPVPEERVLVVGDTPLDVACALAAGVRAVAVATGSYDRAALEASGAHVVFEDLRDQDAFLQLLSQ